MIFSERYAAAIHNGTLKVDLPEAVRDQLTDSMAGHNHTVIVPDTVNTSANSATVMGEASRLLTNYPTIKVPTPGEATSDARWPLINLVLRGPGENVLDGIELMWQGLLERSRILFMNNVNAIFDSAELPWRLNDGECITLDPEFVGSRSTQAALVLLAAGPFAGATAEFHKALCENKASETKNAIRDACNSYESTLKALTGLSSAAGELTNALLKKGYLDDLPEEIRERFRQTVLMGLPFMRNKLGAHGQGPEIVNVPSAYGVLALQLAGALQNFLVSKFLERQPPDPQQIWPPAQADNSPQF